MRLKVQKENLKIPEVPNNYWHLSHEGEPICNELEATIRNIIHQHQSRDTGQSNQLIPLHQKT